MRYCLIRIFCLKGNKSINRLKRSIPFILVWIGSLLPLIAFGLERQSRQDYPFVISVAHPVGQGTGVIVDGSIVTNFHNVEPVFNFQFPIENHLLVIDHKKTPTSVTKITALDAKADLAVVQTRHSSSPIGYSVNSFYEVSKESRGEKATIVGFPDGQFKTVEGIITQVSGSTIEVEKTNKEASEEMDGFSGAPVFINGKLAGIHSRSTEETAYFIPVHIIKDLLVRPTLSCSPAQCIEEEIQRLVSLALNGDEEASDQFREYVEKNLSTMAGVRMFPRYRESQDRVEVDGVQVMKLFTSYYEKFREGNSMEQQVFNKNRFFNLAVQTRWPRAIQLREEHNLRKMRHELSLCRENWSDL